MLLNFNMFLAFRIKFYQCQKGEKTFMKTRGHVLLGIKKKARILGCLAALTGVGLWGTKFVYAMPQGGVIAGGNGSISTAGNAMTVAQQTQNLFVNWDSFSIGKGEKLQFTGPDHFVALNRVVGHDESKIYGEINAANHGNIYLINPNGILIGDGAVINAGSFVASTKDVVDVPDFIASGKVNFQGDAQGNIINLGAVKADRIEMHGDTISLKAANVNTNFNAPQITVDANTIHAGIRDGETTAAVDQKLGVTAEAFQLKDTMQDLRKAVDEDSWGRFMLNGDDLKAETWSDDAPNLSSGASIDGLGYTVANKTITDCQDGSGIFSYATGGSEEKERVRIENFTFDHINVTGRPGSYTGTLVGYLDGDGIRVANVTVANGSVMGESHVGGLIGYSDGFGNGNTFLNVHNVNTRVQGEVKKATSWSDGYTGIGIGGIIGYESGWRNQDQAQNIFRNVSNSGHVIGREQVGGIAGHLVTADMDQVRNTGRIEQQTVGTLVHSQWGDYMQYADSRYIGGIAGSIGPTDEAAANVRISHAYNGGTIGIDPGQLDHEDRPEYASYLGGIVGFLSGGDADRIQGVKNTRIDYAHNAGVVTTGNHNIGGIVGYAGVSRDGNVDDMILHHSWNDAAIRGYEAVGGLAGEFGGRLEESYNNAPVTGIKWGKYIGGLIGKKEGSLYSDLSVRDSYNTAKGLIEATYYVGGILGYNDSPGKLTMKRVYNNGRIQKGIQNVGGIIGCLDNGSGPAELDQLINFGDVDYQDLNDGGMDGYEYGGLIGEADMNSGSSLSLTNSSNYGNINGRFSLGGLIGELYNEENAPVVIKNNRNYGNIYSYIVESAGANNYGPRQVGGLIGEYDPGFDFNFPGFDGTTRLTTQLYSNDNYGNVKAEGLKDDGVGGLIGAMFDGNLEMRDSHNYGTVTSSGLAGGVFGLVTLGNLFNKGNDMPDLDQLHFMLQLHNVSTQGKAFNEGFKEGEWKPRNQDSSKFNPAITAFVNEMKTAGELKENDSWIPDISSHPDTDFLKWKNNITLDYKGQIGNETGNYPDGGYVWKMYENNQKDSDGNTLHHEPLLTAFMTKVETVKNSVNSHDSDVSHALYDVTMPDGQIIQGVDWKRVTALQNQFTRVNNRGDGSQKPAYTASDAESNGSVPNHLYGFYNSSQQGLNIFINPETMEPVKPETPEEPTKPVLPHREISQNDYLYSDDHSTGDGELHWYMHMPPLIYIKDKGVKLGDNQ